MRTIRTQVGIVGGGPAGLMLGHLLHLANVDSVILERRSRAYVIERVRAGVLEQGTVDLMVASGVGSRLQREGLRHEGIQIAFDGARHRIDMAAHTGGRAITIYGQNEVVKDLIDARTSSGRPLHFEVADVSLRDLEGQPRLRYTEGGEACELQCDIIAGCDGSHGVSRLAIPPEHLTVFERDLPYGWLGILADAPPASEELVYACHDRGFALFSMRSPTLTRLYLQCAPDEKIEDWPDDRIWSELLVRLRTGDGWEPRVGPILQKGVTSMRGLVIEPMRYGRLFLAGDAAHIVPPTGAKGLNLAMADVSRLAAAAIDFLRTGHEAGIDSYSERSLRAAWRAQRFSWWMTALLHKSVGIAGSHALRGSTGAAGAIGFDSRRQLAELRYLVESPAAMASLSESYVGVPFE